MPVEIVCIVGGHGEVEALPVLLRRLAWLANPPLDVQIPRPIRVSEGKVLHARDEAVRKREIERTLHLAKGKLAGRGGILALFDLEDECPAERGRRDLPLWAEVAGDSPFGLVFAHREFETWFLASAESLRGARGLPADISPPERPEAVRGAKEWLSRQLGRRYSETIDQPALAERFDLDAAARVDSFDKLRRDFERILRIAQAPDA